MIGSIIMGITFAAAFGGVVLYSLVARGKTELLTAARWSANAAILGVFSSAAILLYYIFMHRFDINYVYEHTSLELSKPLLFSTFYSSQEGSFMLWAVWTSIIAIFLQRYAARQRYEPQVMAVFLAVLTFITLMLVAKSPFISLAAAHPGEVPPGFIPKNGKGLNPTLENLWIVIHPPMLFLGFALLAVPFSFAIAGLIKRDYQGWVTTSMPWTLGAGMVLGFGIMLGGFWASETTGWGGYWAWDPVENASLLPWLITVASAHTMVTQKRTGGLIKTNIAMTLLAYGLVLYGSFLARSGVLENASVHSFAAPGALAFRLLVGVLAFFVIASLFFFIRRWREMSYLGHEYKILSRETSLAIGSAVIGASALVVFIGTSAPMVEKKVDPDFYNRLHVPIAIVLMLVNGLSLLLKWKQTSLQEVFKRGAVALVISLVGAGVVYTMGVHDLGSLAIVAASVFSLIVNLEIGYKVMKGHLAVSMLMKPATKEDIKSRIRTALAISLSLGLLALVIATKGNYNAFGLVVGANIFYFAAFVILLLAFFISVGYPKFDIDSKFLGAYIAHVGVSLFLIGVVASATYSEKELLHLRQDEKTTAFGGRYAFTYRGFEMPEEQYFKYVIDIGTPKKELTGRARPVIFYSSWNNFQSPFSEPGIVKYASKDVYFSVHAVESEGGVPRDTLGKGQVVSVIGGKGELKFLDFDFPQSERAKMMEGGAFTVKASAEFTDKTKPGSQPVPLQLSVTRNLQTNESNQEDVVVPGTPFHVQMVELKPDMQHKENSKVVLRAFDETAPPPPTKEVITVEAFIKPYINFVWLGILTLVAGFGFSVARRRREAMLAITRAEAAYEKLISKRAPSVGDKDAMHEPAKRSTTRERKSA